MYLWKGNDGNEKKTKDVSDDGNNYFDVLLFGYDC